MKEDEYQEPEDLEEDEEEEATPEEMKAEALERMKLLQIFPETVKQFDEDGLISIAEPVIGAHYWADDNIKQVINDFQNEYGGLVYYGILTVYEEIGRLYSLFYVSKYKSEWPLDREDIDAGEACVYVYNQSEPEFSEIGNICYEHTGAGSLRRTY